MYSIQSTSPLSAELHAILGPVTYIISEMPADTSMGLWTHTPLQSYIKEGQAPILVTAWCTDVSSKSNLPHWTAVAILLSTDTIWQDGGSQQKQSIGRAGSGLNGTNTWTEPYHSGDWQLGSLQRPPLVNRTMERGQLRSSSLPIMESWNVKWDLGTDKRLGGHSVPWTGTQCSDSSRI